MLRWRMLPGARTVLLPHAELEFEYRSSYVSTAITSRVLDGAAG